MPPPRVFVCRPQIRALADELAAKTGAIHVLELADNGGGNLAEGAALQPDNFSTIVRTGDDLRERSWTFYEAVT
jgi:hypothetical protein